MRAVLSTDMDCLVLLNDKGACGIGRRADGLFCVCPAVGVPPSVDGGIRTPDWKTALSFALKFLGEEVQSEDGSDSSNGQAGDS